MHSVRRKSALPIVMLLADRFASTVAPASAPNVLGGSGTQTSSQTSTCRTRPGQVGGREHEVGPDRDRRPEQLDLAADELPRGAELPLLVVLAVVGQIALGDDAEHAPAVDHEADVEDAVLRPQRPADDDHRQQLAAGGDELLDGVEHRVGQRVLLEEVVDRVRREPELGEDDDRRALVRRARGEPERALEVEDGLGRAQVRHRGGHAREPVAVERVEGHRAARYPSTGTPRPLAI